MKQADDALIERQTQSALEYDPAGQPVQWRNPESGHYGDIVPQAAFQRAGSYCREFRQTRVMNRNSQQAFGTACRQTDGSWKIVS